jgi:hypothetical protein
LISAAAPAPTGRSTGAGQRRHARRSPIQDTAALARTTCRAQRGGSTTGACEDA